MFTLQAKRKRQHMGDVKIVVAGCVASQEGSALLRRIPEVDLVMGPQHANRIDSLLDEVDLGSQVLAVDPIHISEDVTVPRRDSDVTAWVNVIHGCNERCTYCVVPNTRGREQSRTPEAIKVSNCLYQSYISDQRFFYVSLLLYSHWMKSLQVIVVSSHKNNSRCQNRIMTYSALGSLCTVLWKMGIETSG